MPFAALKQRSVSKPAYPRVNGANHFGRHLQFGIYFAEGAGLPYMIGPKSVPQQAVLSGSVQPEWRADEKGRYLYLDNNPTSNNVELAWTMPSDTVGTEPYTWVTEVYWVTDAGTDYRGFASMYSTNPVEPGMYFDVTSNRWGMWYVSGGRLANSTLSTGQWYTLATVRDGDTFTFYLDGEADGSVTHGTIANDGNDTQFNIGVGRPGIAGDRQEMYIRYFQSFRRALSHAEIRDLYARPYQAVTVDKYHWVQIAAAGGGGLPAGSLSLLGVGI